MPPRDLLAIEQGRTASSQCVPVQLQVGHEEAFTGVIDLVSMRAIYWSNDDQGLSFEDRPIPADQLADAEYYREQMVEASTICSR